jgi:hypothetical protein
MMENCYDIGTIQAFLDGELSSDLSENVARHIDLCDACAAQMATAGDETAFAYSALEQEFNTLVPTQRLWAKINDSIESERKSFWKPIFAFFRNPALATFAAFLVVFGLFVVYLNSGQDTSNYVAKISQGKPETITTTNPSKVVAADTNAPVGKTLTSEKIVSSDESRKTFQVENTKFVANKPKIVTRYNANQVETPITTPAVYESLPGEESYIKTIATLERTVNDKKDEVLKPSSRVRFEKDLALVNDAIDKMRTQVKENPKNDTAKEVLMSSYQNKVDLLNSVAGKTELMASLK